MEVSGGEIQVNGQTSMDALQLTLGDAFVGVAPGATLALAQLENARVVDVEGSLHFRHTDPHDPCALSGNGEVRLAGGAITGTAIVGCDAVATLRGHGTIGAPLANSGAILADTPGGWLVLGECDKRNELTGTLVAMDGALLGIEGIRLENLGLVDVTETSHLLLDAAVLDNVGAGHTDVLGTYELRNGAMVFGAFNAPAGSAGTLGAGGGVYGLGDATVGGTLDVLNRPADGATDTLVRFDGGLAVEATGVVRAEGGTTLVLNGPLSVASTERTEFDLAGADVTIQSESITADPYEMEIAGNDLGAVTAGWDDNFAVASLALGGEAPGRISLTDDADSHGDGLGNEALYVSELLLGVGACIRLNDLPLYYRNGEDPKRLAYGDTDLDGDVDAVDLAGFGLAWAPDGSGNAWSEGDFDGDGDVDAVDLAALGLAWAPAGTDGAGPAGTLPEPATLALVALGAAVVARRRHER